MSQSAKWRRGRLTRAVGGTAVSAVGHARTYILFFFFFFFFFFIFFFFRAAGWAPGHFSLFSQPALSSWTQPFLYFFSFGLAANC